MVKKTVQPSRGRLCDFPAGGFPQFARILGHYDPPRRGPRLRALICARSQRVRRIFEVFLQKQISKIFFPKPHGLSYGAGAGKNVFSAQTSPQ